MYKGLTSLLRATYKQQPKNNRCLCRIGAKPHWFDFEGVTPFCLIIHAGHNYSIVNEAISFDWN